MMKETTIAITVIVLAAVGFFAWQAVQPEQPVVTNFEECAAAGNPIMESYPRQCRSENGLLFVEEIPREPISLAEAEARLIAERECIKGGEALSPGAYNANTKAWWFDANLNAMREGCSSVCIVSEETRAAELSWRCSGASPASSGGTTLAGQLAECLPKSDTASREKCDRLLNEIRNYDECIAAGFAMMKSNPPQCATPDGRSFTQKTNTSWDALVKTIQSCEAISVMQTHERLVRVRLADGRELVAAEPSIDDVFDIVRVSQKVCGPIPLATE